MKDQRQQQYNANKDQLNKSNLLEPLLTISLSQSYVSLQKSPVSQYKKDDLADNTQKEQKKLNLNENPTTRSNQKGKLRFGRDSMLKNTSFELPQIKGVQSLNPQDILHVNSVSQSRYLPKQEKLNDLQQYNQQSTKSNDQFTNLYKQKVLKQNQVTKRKLLENASSIQSSYIPLSSKIQEREIQQNSQNLLIMGSSNKKKLPAIQELQKSTNSSQIALTPLKLISKQNQQNKSANNLNQNQLKPNNIYSQPMNLNLQPENSFNNKSIQNTSIDSNNLNFKRESINNESIVINSISQRFSKDSNTSNELSKYKNLNELISAPKNLNNNNKKNTDKNINIIKEINTPKNINDNEDSNINIAGSTTNQIQHFNSNNQEQEKNNQVNQSEQSINSLNKIQKQEVNEIIKAEDEERDEERTVQKGQKSKNTAKIQEEDEERTVQKGSKQKNSINSQNREVKFNVEQKGVTYQQNKFSNLNENNQKSSINTDKSSKSTFEDLNSILKNKKSDSQVQINEIVSNPQIHQVLSSKRTQNQELTKSMEVSTFQSSQINIQYEDEQQFEDYDRDDSFEEEERENEINIKEQEDIDDENNTLLSNMDDKSPNNDSIDDEQTICFKQQVQQQLIQQHKSKEILKTLVQNKGKKQVQSPTKMTESTYQSRLETIRLSYNQQESKISVIHNKTDFSIEIFSDDSGGGKYDWKINDVMLGAGSQGRVYKAFCSKQVKNFALKMVYLDDFEGPYAKDVINEILILKQIRGHSPFLQLYDVFGLQQQNCNLFNSFTI